MNDPAVIQPVCGGAAKKGPDLAVMAATLPDLTGLADMMGLSRDDYRDFFSARLYTGEKDGHGFFLAGPFIGAPHAAILLENLIVRGVTQILFVGWCGTLCDDPAVGDVLMAQGACSDEGTSRHYGVFDSGAFLETSKTLNVRLASAMESRNIPVKRVRIWTTDALYRETPEKIAHFRNRGACAVEMELSALLAVSAFRGVELSGLLLVSDDVGGLTWKPGFKDPRFKAGRKKLSSIVQTFLENRGETGHGS